MTIYIVAEATHHNNNLITYVAKTRQEAFNWMVNRYNVALKCAHDTLNFAMCKYADAYVDSLNEYIYWNINEEEIEA